MVKVVALLHMSSANAMNHMNERPSPLRLARIVRGLSQLDIARRIGVSLWRYARIERGVSPARPDELHRLSELLGIPESSLREIA